METGYALGCTRKRGAVAVLVAVCMVVLLGVAALTVDVGAIYNARSDLQRSADSAALAAAAMLSDFEHGDPVAQARQVAQTYAKDNGVLGRNVTLDADKDITFLRASYDPRANEYTFTPNNVLPDAVRVDIRLSEESPNGPLSLFFAGIFGKVSADVSASATAMMIPRDIAIAADLSASHTDDSELRNYRNTDINLWDVWAALPGGIDDGIGSIWTLAIPPGWIDGQGAAPQAAGPAWGYMQKMGYGTMDLDSSYSPASDPGLVYLPYRQNWSDASLSAYLTTLGYNAGEINAIMNRGSSDTSSSYPNRVAVAMGLAYWNSGMVGGRWSLAGQPAGNGNTSISSNEMVWAATIMGRSANESAGLWQDYIWDYASSTSTMMYEANAQFRYRYGAKTVTNFLLEDRPQNNQTPEFASTPTQPMQAVKDGVGHMMQVLTSLQTQDLVSLEVYSTTGRHEVNLTGDFQQVSNRLNEMQAAHYDRYTNIGAGLERAIEELSSVRARSVSRKIIVLYTDGVANVNEHGNVDYAGAKAYALEMAQQAADRGFKIYAVSVGSEPDLSTMDQIAEIGNGIHLHAEGSIEEYSDQLDEIFNALGGDRSVQLVQ